MTFFETPSLRIERLTIRYGAGCPACMGGGILEKTAAPHAIRFGALKASPWRFIPAKS